MPTNFYFNNFPANQITQEQLLVEDLVIEAMQIYGMDVYYLPRTSRDSVDFLYGEDTLKQYLAAYPIEMYLENVSGMEGEGDFISKFGLEIRDEMSFLVSRRRFRYTTGPSNLTRPREGDLIYVPLVQNFFEITFVEHENDQAMFHTLGRGRGGNVYVYALKLKQFVFSNEVIATGVDEVDEQIRDHYARSRITMVQGVGAGAFANDEIVFQSTDNTLANASATAIVHSWTNTASARTLDLYRINGTFANNSNTIGATSGAYYTTSGLADQTAFDNDIFEDIADNTRIQNESDGIIDFSETNPFGEP
jgi:hypothetical protein